MISRPISSFIIAQIYLPFQYKKKTEYIIVSKSYNVKHGPMAYKLKMMRKQKMDNGEKENIVRH